MKMKPNQVLLMCLLYSFMAVLPAELENVSDDFLHKLEWLLNLGLDKRGEVNYSHVHLHTKESRRESKQHGG